MTEKVKTPFNMRTFYTIWFGQLVSTLGSGLTGFAVGVYIYQKTGSVTLFALNILMFTLPGVFFSPIAGALVDRLPRRAVMILSDTGAGLSTLFLFVMLSMGDLQTWHIYVASFFNSLFSTFQWPAYSAATTMLVPQKDLGKAGGMVQIGEAISQLLSPALAGALFALWGLRGVMLVDAVTFGFAVITLLMVRIPEPERSSDADGAEKKSIWQDIRFGLNYIMERRGLFNLLMYFATINFLFSMIGPLIMPMMLELGTVEQAGYASSGIGVGMLVGTLIMSAWGGPKRRVFGVLGAGAWSALMIMGLGAQPSILLIGVVGFLTMVSMPIMNGSSQALWQSKTNPDVQGRVFSVRRMLAQFTAPFSILLAGPLVDKILQPMMNEGGALASSFGRVIGTGPGRGAALLFVLIGLLQLIATGVAFAVPALRRVDIDLPNVEVKAREEDEALAEEPVVAAA